ncbi:MAG: putative DNA-binding domain-containing protein [Porticoccaceae bacterium]|nr:putative DNA-binding domain-containing protein [Porticoccaceae bacterium]
MRRELQVASQPAFQRAQFELAAHIRNPQSNPAPEGIEDRRLEIYRSLFFNNIEGFIANGFPILKSITEPDQWGTIVRDFVHRHQSHSPYFLDIGSEFLHYLQSERISQPEDPVFMLQLAHYEWVELALDVSVLDYPEAQIEGDLLDNRPLVSPLAWVMSYNYPVHLIGPDFQPTEASSDATHIIVYRDRQMQVGFMEINRTTQRLLEILDKDKLSGRGALLQLATELEYSNPDAILEFGASLLSQLHSKDIICGFN